MVHEPPLAVLVKGSVRQHVPRNVPKSALNRGLVGVDSSPKFTSLEDEDDAPMLSSNRPRKSDGWVQATHPQIRLTSSGCGDHF